MKIKETIDRKRLKKLEKQRKKYIYLQGKKTRFLKTIETENSRSCFKNALCSFSFPFKKGAFRELFYAVGITFFAVFGLGLPFVLIALIFCALADLAYLLLFVVLFPLTCLYFKYFKEKRSERFQKKADKIEDLLEKMTPPATLNKEIKKIEKKLQPKYTYTSSSSRMEETQYYKDKKDEYYRMYMGYPPKEEKSGLSYLSTDTSLDLHPGDY